MTTTCLLSLLLIMASTALADVKPSKTTLTVPPGRPSLLAPDGSGVNKIAITFDISGLNQGSGVVEEGVEPEVHGRQEIESALLEWTVPGVPNDRMTDCAVYGITSAWETGEDGSVSLATTSDPLATWEITPLDHLVGTGNLVRLDVRDWVRGWARGSIPNYGLVLATRDLSEEMITGQISAAGLIIRFGRVGE